MTEVFPGEAKRPAQRSAPWHNPFSASRVRSTRPERINVKRTVKMSLGEYDTGPHIRNDQRKLGLPFVWNG